MSALKVPPPAKKTQPPMEEAVLRRGPYCPMCGRDYWREYVESRKTQPPEPEVAPTSKAVLLINLLGVLVVVMFIVGVYVGGRL